jgi:serine/threonine protein kinase
VFSLGCVLAYAVTGRAPFDAPTVPAIIFRILNEPPDLGDLPAGVLRDALAACLAKDPGRRPLLSDLLARFTAGSPHSLAPAVGENRAPGTLSERDPGGDLDVSPGEVVHGAVVPDVRFWNVPAGNNFAATTPAQTLATHSGQIAVISYSAPLGLLATGTPVTTRVWETSPARIAANICQSLKAPVLPTLWKEYLPDIPYSPVCG